MTNKTVGQVILTAHSISFTGFFLSGYEYSASWEGIGMLAYFVGFVFMIIGAFRLMKV